MSVHRLRTRRDRASEAGVERLRSAVLQADDGSSPELVSRLVTLLDREVSSRRGWRFVMVEPRLYAEVVAYLAEHSRRKITAMKLWARLFEVLPPDSNEVIVDRRELARLVGCEPAHVSEIMRELEEIGVVYRRREGRGVRYFVHPKLGTHLTGAARDRAQAEAPPLRLVETVPAE
ncbi:MAG TPA: helix-turn-helix domain-containing protein [Gemmataceae bacterium]|nr:helix-turn-helix domain-containing protein [Gemmataceae bacterium]